MRNILFVCLTTISFSLFGKELVVENEKIHAVCSFEQVDYFTTFSPQGEFLWEVPFAAKIVSWKKEEGLLVVLSKARNGLSYYLSSIDPMEGKIVWEKAILAPTPTTNLPMASD